MPATHKLYKNTVLFALALAVVLAAPVLAQPQFQVSNSNVVLQGTQGAFVTVTSSGASQGNQITFDISAPDYSSDANRGGINWLAVAPTGSGFVTPFSGINLNQVTTAGLPVGKHTATVTLTATSPATGVTAAVINVSFDNSAGGGGGGGTLSAAPNPINLTASFSNAVSTNVAITTSSVSLININSVVPTITTGSTSWLSAAIAAGASSAISTAGGTTLTVQANPFGLSAGTYQGTVTVTPSVGTALSIQVNFTVGTASNGSVTFSPTNVLSWSFTSNGTFPPAQTLSVLSSTGASTYTATATSSNGWLLINGSTSIQGLVSSGILVQPGSNITSLGTGSYTGTVQVTDSNGGTGSITVNLTVNGGTSTGLSITPNPLTFNIALNGAASQQNLTVTSTSGGAFSATASGGSWLSASTNVGSLASNSAGTVFVIVNPSGAGLAGGTYFGSINVTVGQQSQAVSVTLNFAGGGGGGNNTTNLQPTSVSLTFQSGTPPYFISRPWISITGPTGNWTSAVSTSSGGNWLSISPSSGISLPDQTQVIVDQTILPTLAPGNYAGTISITTPGGTQSVTVSLAVSTGAVLLYSTQGAPLIYNFQTGGGLPAGQTLFFTASDGSAFDLTTASVTANASWINVAVFQHSISVSVDPTGLTGGVYTGTITVNAAPFGAVNLAVVLVINNGSGGGTSGPLSFAPASIAFSAVAGTTPNPVNLSVSSTIASSFTVVASTQTGGGNWLTVTPTSSVTNTTLSVSASPAGLGAGTYNGTLTFNSNGTIQTVPVSLTVTGGGGGTGSVTVTPATLAFTAQAPAGVLPVQALAVNGTGTYTVQVTTTNGGSWLTTTAGLSTLNAGQALTVTANATGLAVGAYQGRIRIISGNVVDVPVTLTLTAPPTVTATPTSLTFTYRTGDATPASKQISVDGGGAALTFSASATSSGNWLDVTPKAGTTPVTLIVSVNPANLAASTYIGTITVTGTGSATGTTAITVQITVTTPPATITKVGSAASYIAGTISPGEVITIFGTSIGPATPVGAALDSSGKVSTTIGNTQVLVGGFPAPMIFASSTQVSAVVPYEIAGFANPNVQVKYLGQTSNGVLVNVASTHPGLFTLNASGTGPGAILNQNASTNGPSNPAARGETVVVFLTGEGQTNPGGVTGKVTTVNSAPPFTPAPLLPIAILVGGQPAQYSFAGEAPTFVSGVMQLNLTIPQNIGTGELPITVSIGNNTSQSGVTVSVR